MNHKSLVLVDKTDIKIFVHGLLDEINHPMTYTAIVDTVVDSGCVGGFDFSGDITPGRNRAKQCQKYRQIASRSQKT